MNAGWLAARLTGVQRQQQQQQAMKMTREIICVSLCGWWGRKRHTNQLSYGHDCGNHVKGSSFQEMITTSLSQQVPGIYIC